MTTEGIRILLVGDQSLLQLGINTLLATTTTEDVTLVGTAASSNEAVALYQTVQPDVLLFVSAVSLRLQVVKRLVQKYPAVRILVIQVNEDETRLKKLVDSGVTGCFLHSDPPEKFVEAIRAVAEGKPWISHALYAKFIQLEMDSRPRDLTTRERQVLRLIVRGASNREIALTLQIVERTVEYHISNILKKIGATSRVEAAVWATRRDKEMNFS